MAKRVYKPRAPGGLRAAVTRHSQRATAAAMAVLHEASRPWFLVQTRPSHEMQTQIAIERMDIPSILPLQARYRRENRHTSKGRRMVPALPRVLFIAPSTPGAWFPLFDRGHISGVMSVDGSPRPVEPREVAIFLERLDPTLIAPDAHQHMPTGREYAIGDHVEVLTGPFAGHMVEVTAIKGKRAEVLCEVLGAVRPIQVGLGDLAAA